jgi:hypothetical protein
VVQDRALWVALVNMEMNEDSCLLGCSVMLSVRSLPTFQRSLLPIIRAMSDHPDDGGFEVLTVVSTKMAVFIFETVFLSLQRVAIQPRLDIIVWTKCR